MKDLCQASASGLSLQSFRTSAVDRVSGEFSKLCLIVMHFLNGGTLQSCGESAVAVLKTQVGGNFELLSYAIVKECSWP